MRTISALFLALGLVACGGDPNVNDDGTEVQSESVTVGLCEWNPATHIQTGNCVKPATCGPVPSTYCAKGLTYKSAGVTQCSVPVSSQTCL